MKKAKDLQEGDLFKLPNQRKFRVFKKSVTLENSPLIHHRDKLLIVTDECNHFIVLPDDDIETKHSE